MRSLGLNRSESLKKISVLKKEKHNSPTKLFQSPSIFHLTYLCHVLFSFWRWIFETDLNMTKKIIKIKTRHWYGRLNSMTSYIRWRFPALGL